MTKRRRPADPPRVDYVPGQLDLDGQTALPPSMMLASEVEDELHAAPPDKVTAADRRMARALATYCTCGEPKGEHYPDCPLYPAWRRAEGLRERVAAALAAHHYELEIVTLFELRGFCWCGGWSTAVDYSGKLTDLTAALHAEWAEHRLDAIVAAVASTS